MAPTKVFVGNLSFKTREAELAQEFGAAGKVLSANIITRGPRSLGYGFVELESEEEAERSVTLLNKKEIDGRQINVEVARPRVERPEGETDASAPQDGGAQRGSGRRGGRGRGSGRARGEPRQPREPREPREEGEQREQREPRAPRARRPRGGAAAPAEGQQQQTGAEGDQTQTRTRRARAPRGPRGGAAASGAAPAGAAPAAPRQPRAPRRADDGPREESETTLFVANLPFSVTDEQLKSEFSANGLAVKSAHVVTRVTGRSKGYGFVDFESKKDQTAALAAFEHKALDGRELIVKIALKDNRPPSASVDGVTAAVQNL